ncbi:hypothetical protein ABYF34_05605 [Buchananella felis]
MGHVAGGACRAENGGAEGAAAPARCGAGRRGGNVVHPAVPPVAVV